MTRIAWATDIHLNFIRPVDGPKWFGSYLAEEHPADCLIVSGDISEKHSLKDHIESLQEGYVKPVHWVMGNHDFYGSSIKKTLKMATELKGWLTKAGVVELNPTTALIGIEGWYDALFGNPYGEFDMSDWRAIKEYRVSGVRRNGRGGIIRLSRDLSLSNVKAFSPILDEALEKFPVVVMATHFPPFEEASYYDFRFSSPNTLPWYSSKMMGVLLLEKMRKNPHRKLLVLCGHTHHSAYHKALPNLITLTGKAVYKAPDLAGILDIDSPNHIRVKRKTETGWVEQVLWQ